jgi:hypothetical protein
MSTEYNTSGSFDLLVSLDFKIMNNLKKNTDSVF